MGKKLWLLGLALWTTYAGAWLWQTYALPKPVEGVVVDRYVKRVGRHQSDHYHVVVASPDGRVEVLQCRDAWLRGVWASADDYARLRVGSTVRGRAFGSRIPLFSWFRRLECEKMLENGRSVR